MTGMSGSEMLSHTGAAAVVLVVAFGFFSRNWIGGGDAKLAAATALWLGFDHLLDYLIYASLGGGMLTLVLIQFRTMPLPNALQGTDWAERLHRLDGGIPYGIALGGGRARGLSAHRVDAGHRPLAPRSALSRTAAAPNRATCY